MFPRLCGKFLYSLESFQKVWKVSRHYGKFPASPRWLKLAAFWRGQKCPQKLLLGAFLLFLRQIGRFYADLQICQFNSVLYLPKDFQKVRKLWQFLFSRQCSVWKCLKLSFNFQLFGEDPSCFPTTSATLSQSENFQPLQKVSKQSDSFQMVFKLSRKSGEFPDSLESFRRV